MRDRRRLAATSVTVTANQLQRRVRRPHESSVRLRPPPPETTQHGTAPYGDPDGAHQGPLSQVAGKIWWWHGRPQPTPSGGTSQLGLALGRAQLRPRLDGLTGRTSTSGVRWCPTAGDVHPDGSIDFAFPAPSPNAVNHHPPGAWPTSSSGGCLFAHGATSHDSRKKTTAPTKQLGYATDAANALSQLRT